MPTVDASEFKRKLRHRIKFIQFSLPITLENLGHEIYDDIETGAIEPFSPSWKTAIKGDNSGRYFTPISNGGIFDVIKEARYDSIRTTSTSKVFSLDIGNINALDAASISQKGYPYWRLFEFGTIGSRSGGSKDFGYVPFQGGGYSDKVSPYGRATRPNPGVLPVFLFGDTFRYFKPKIHARVRDLIADIVAGKYDNTPIF